MSRPDPIADPSDRASRPSPVEMSPVDQARLLELARLAIVVAAGVRPEADLRAAIAAGARPGAQAGAFVTITAHDELRGCMGNLDPESAVWASVVDAAGWAAREDPRFSRVRERDLVLLHVDVSVLGPAVLLSDPLAWRLGVDGVMVRRGGRRGLLLPEVADEVANGREEMLDICCSKAGLWKGAWREAPTEVLAFRTLRFGGPVLERVPE
jgi:AmmeMemoRadiSam system protein A